jgi:hypothetical protein
LHRRCAEVGPDPAVNQSTILRVDGGRDGHHGSNKCETRSAHARVHQRDSIANASRWSGFQSHGAKLAGQERGHTKARARLAGQARGPNGRLAAKKGPLVSANGELSPLSRTQTSHWAKKNAAESGRAELRTLGGNPTSALQHTISVATACQSRRRKRLVGAKKAPRKGANAGPNLRPSTCGTGTFV